METEKTFADSKRTVCLGTGEARRVCPNTVKMWSGWYGACAAMR